MEKIRQFIWKIKDKYAGKEHTHEREKKRRAKQITSMKLKKENGLKV